MTPSRTARLLYFTRSAGYLHSPVRRNGKGLAFSETILTELGRQCGVEVIATKDGRVFDEDLDGYDAIAFYTLGELTRESGEPTPPMSSRGKEKLLEAVATGKGFLGFHSACDTFLSRNGQIDPYIAMIGGEFVTHDIMQHAAMQVVSAQFPGVGELGASSALYEEWYTLKNFAPDLHVIHVQQTADMVGECYRRPPFPITWARMHGKGRVFFTTLGHRENIWTQSAFQQLAMVGLEWVLGRLDVDITPNVAQVAPHADQWPREHCTSHLRTVRVPAAKVPPEDASRIVGTQPQGQQGQAAERSDLTVEDLSPEPILAAAEAFRGRWIDMDRGLVVGSESFIRGWCDLAQQMRRLGLNAGDRVVLAIGNGPLFPAALTAVLADGGSPLLLHADTPATELKRTARRYGAKFLVCDGSKETDFRTGAPHTAMLNADDWGSAAWEAVDQTDPEFDADWEPLPGIPLHPTSGTTGVPKLAARPGRAAVADASHFIESLGIEPSDVLLAAGPMNHMYTYGLGVMAPLLQGATCVTMQRFQTKLVYQAVQEHRVTIFPTVPAMLDVLLFGAGERLRSFVRRVLVAGAPLPEKTARSFWKAAAVMVQPHYGATETGGISTADSAQSGDFGRCVGRPMPGVSVEVRPSLIHPDLPPGTGTVCVRSEAMMAGYVARRGINTSPLEQGWLRTGDLAERDPSGALYLKGRENEVINVAGLKVVPSEVEEVIALLAGVVEVKVYPGVYPSGAQYVKAAVVAQPPLDVAAVRAHCQQTLVYYKRPERIALLDALPRSPAGKIVRERLP
jgi:acyl-coenzyme A synthetase/AMP-(fatty) acid ligase/type 1 glutamine amidotransferase